MVTVERREDVEEAMKEVFELFAQPVTTTSRFYTHLYLADVKQRDEFDFELFKLKNKLSDAFINYTVYAVAREIGNKDQKLELDGFSMRELARGRVNELTAERYSDIRRENSNTPTLGEILDGQKGRLISAFVGGMNEDHTLGKNILMDNTFRIPRGTKLEGIIDVMEDMETKYSVLSNPFMFLEEAKRIFNFNYSAAVGETWWTREVGGESGWSINYGGEAWGAVCETAMQARDLSDKAYVDIMFSVEHNNGNFLNKIPEIDESEREMVEKFFPQYEGSTFIKTEIYDTIMPAILDAAKEENIRPLYKIAKDSDSSLRTRSLQASVFPPGRNLLDDGEDTEGDGSEVF
jgi:hypothetical protein